MLTLGPRAAAVQDPMSATWLPNSICTFASRPSCSPARSASRRPALSDGVAHLSQPSNGLPSIQVDLRVVPLVFTLFR